MTHFCDDIWQKIMSFFHSIYKIPYHYDAITNVATFVEFRNIAYSQNEYTYYKHLQHMNRHYFKSPKWLQMHSTKPDIILNKTYNANIHFD